MRHFLALAIVLGVFTAKGQRVFSEFVFGTHLSERLRSVVQHSSKDLYSAGYAFNEVTQKFNVTFHKTAENGDLVWSKTFESSYNQYALTINLTADGNLILCGEAETANDDLDFLIMKLDTSGSIIWSKIYGGPKTQSANYIEETKDGGFVLCGFVSDSYNTNDVYVSKIDRNANLIWETTFGGEDNDYGFMALELENGNFIVTSDSRSFGAGGYDVYLLMLDENGGIIWEKTFGDRFNNGCQGIMITNDGHLLSFGETEVYTGSPFDYFIEKIDFDGNSIWKKIIGGEGSDAAFAVVEGESGDFYFTGYSTVPGDLKNLVIFKTDSVGNLLWEERFGDAGINIGYDIRKSKELNRFFVAGFFTLEKEKNALIIFDDNKETGIARQRKSDLILYPNPVRDGKIFIETAEYFHWQLNSISGAKIDCGYSSTGQTFIEIPANTPPGMYVIQIWSSEVKSTKKIILAP
jgi:hypothetical protein